MNKQITFLIFSGILSFFITKSISVLLIYILLFCIGSLTVYYFQPENLKNQSLKIFQITYQVYFIYALMCFIFMQMNGFEYLQSFDGYSVYIPYVKELVNTNSFFELISKIYSTPHYSLVGSILVLFVYIGKLSLLIDGELYLSIQISIILFASWTSVVVFNILAYKKIELKKAVKLTFLYSFLSIHFILSTFIVRDMPIALFFTLIIYFSFKPVKTRTILMMGILILLICSIRLATGIFAVVYIFLALILADKKGSMKKQIGIFSILLILIGMTLVFAGKIQMLVEIKMSQYAAFEKADQEGASTVYSFNALPVGVSHLVKAMYNQIMPIPSWNSMIQTSYRPESFNVMNFPVIPATLFRYCMWGVIFIGILNLNVIKRLWEDKALVYYFIIAIFFLMLHSSSMGHRRMLGVYPLFFLISVLIFQQYNKKDRYIMLLITSFIFILTQTFYYFSTI